MGLDVNGARFILYARTPGVDFTPTATIGRQGLHPSAPDLRASLQRFGFSFDDALIERVFSENGGYAERFFRSNIPGQFKRQYSAVLDGGSLEHVFSFPTAIKNCMFTPGNGYEPLRSMPQQSDYVGAWKGVDAPVRRRPLQSMDPTGGVRSADKVLR